MKVRGNDVLLPTTIVGAYPRPIFMEGKVFGEGVHAPEFPSYRMRELYRHAVALAVKVGAVAMPPAFVFALPGLPPVNVPLAPLAGGVKVTGTLFWTTFDSFTVACSAVANAVLMVALWLLPAAAASE